MNGTRVVDLAPEGSGADRSGTITLSPGAHTLRVRVFDASGPADLTLDYSGPGFLREPIPASAFPRLADLPLTVATDPDDGDVNGIPLIGDSSVTLPSTARVSLPRARDVALHYDGLHSFLRTLSQDRATDTFTLTVVDAAGASAEVTVNADWPIYTGNFLQYTDSRFTPHLGPRTVQIINNYRFPVPMITYIEHRETGDVFGHSQHELASGHVLHLDFEIPEGVDIGDQHFYDLYDLHIDTLDGDPIYYGSSYHDVQLDRLYSTATESFFRFRGAISPHWPYRVETVRGTTLYRSGFHRVVTNYGGIAQVFRLDVLARGASANKAVLEPNFAANIAVQGVCRTRDISRFTVRIESVNFPSIRSDPVTLGNESEEFILLNPQGQNLGGTEGRLIILLPDREEIGPTFIFSDDPC